MEREGRQGREPAVTRCSQPDPQLAPRKVGPAPCLHGAQNRTVTWRQPLLLLLGAGGENAVCPQ